MQINHEVHGPTILTEICQLQRRNSYGITYVKYVYILQSCKLDVEIVTWDKDIVSTDIFLQNCAQKYNYA